MATIYEDIVSPPDAAASTETQYGMSVGDTFNGILDQKFDEDWIKIELEKGKTYKINLSGRGEGGDEAEDTILKLFDSKGDHIVTNDDIDTANKIYDSELIFTATADDTYHISASSYTSNPTLDNSGGYMITVEEYELVVDTSIKGTNASNRLPGTNDGEKISGLGGNDTLYGLGGDDELDGGTGDDTLVGGAGADKLTGGTGNDTASYTGSSAGVTVRLHNPSPRGGDAVGDTFEETVSFTYTDESRRVTKDLPDIENLTGSDHDDILAGDERANRLSGGRGDDIIYGGPGGDDTNSDTMYGGTGNDKLYGGRGDDKLYGSTGNDELRGGDDDDTLSGGSGTDKLYGGDGDDILDGGSGDDILEGGDGEDIFRFSQDDGDDDIKGFSTSRSDGDRIDLTDFEDIDSMNDLDIKQRGDDTRIDLDEHDGGEIWLLDFDKDDLDDEDFIFYNDRGRPDPDRPDPDRPDPITGDPDDDILYGSSANNRLNGGAGDDVLYGGPGDDELRGGPGVDSFEGGPGSDTMIVDAYDVFSIDDEGAYSARTEEDAIDGGENPGGSENSDTLSFEDWVDDTHRDGVTVDLSAETVTYRGVTSTRVYNNIEHIIGSRYDDTLTGDGGDNVIEGGDEDDMLDGGNEGAGGDTVSYRSSDDGVTVSLVSGFTLEGGHAAGDEISNFENIIGSGHADTLTGDTGANVIEGLAGSDTLDGGAGTDTLSYQSSPGGVQVDLNQGDLDDGTRLIERSAGGHAAGDKVTFATFENIIGSRYGDTLTGDNNANTLTGGAGNDELHGDDGADMLFGGAGIDRLYGDDENDTLTGGAGADRLDGGDNGTDGDTASYAGAPAGVTLDLAAGRGREGDANGDTFFDIENFTGSDHDDTFIASDDPDNIDGGGHAGDDMGDADGVDGDTVSYEKSTAAVTVTLGGAIEGGYAEDDTLAGIENVTGSAHRDTLVGDNSANVLNGGGDNDTLTGNGGADIFRFAGRHGNDDITDFSQGEDKIDLSAFRNIASIEDLEDLIEPGTDTHIDLSGHGGGDIELDDFSGTGNETLTNDDFIFYSRPIGVKLTGGPKADTLRGSNGDNRLNGKEGNDVLYGGDGNDELTGGDGADTLHGGKGSDTFFITYEEDTNNIVIKDTVFGEGNDLNEDGTTSTVIPAPDDQDTISYVDWDNDADDGVTLNLVSNPGNDSTEVDDIENIIGSEHEDDLTGDGGDNVIEGGDEDDMLDGGNEGAGGDTVSYRSSDDGVTVSLVSGFTLEGGHAAGDEISNFENIIGSGHADTLTGDTGANVIEGLAGSDTLDGGAGTDTLSYQSSPGGVQVDLNQGDLDDGTRLIERSAGGHAAGDKVTFATFENIIGSRYGDTLTGDNNANTLTGGAGNDELHGDDGADMLFGGAGIDRLYGDDENDTLTGGAGADRLDGGDNGTDGDTASYAGAPAGVTLDLAAGRGREGDANGDTFFDIENFTGSDHDDTFIASDDPDNIDGGGHAGDDMGDADGVDGDTVSYEKSTAAVTVTLGGAIEGGYAEDDTLAGIENVTGSAHRDTLVGDNSANVLNGGGGNDMLTGNGGNDIFKFAGRHGNDDITDFDQGVDKIDLSAFRNIASIEDLEDHITPGTDTEIDLDAYGGGEIELEDFSGTGNETLTNDDFIFYSTTRNGSSGNNTLTGDRGRDVINGGAGDDNLFGNAGKDTLNGDADDDTLYGGADDDILNGGEGDDVLDGGPGADTFVFAPGNGNDYIMDFNTEGDDDNADKIDLTAFDNITGLGNLTQSQVGGNTVINLPGEDGGTITLLGIGSDLADGDFLF